MVSWLLLIQLEGAIISQLRLVDISTNISTSSRLCDVIYCVEQIRCKKSGLCKGTGTSIIVTDLHPDKSNTTDFVLSSRAYRAMALPGKDKQLLQLGIADVEYKR